MNRPVKGMTRNEPNRNCAGVKIQVRIAPTILYVTDIYCY